MIRLLLLIFVLAGIATLPSCQDSQGPPITDDFDRSGELHKLRVYTYENSRGVTNAYKEYVESKGQEFDGVQREGWAAWSDSEGEHVCHLHVVKIDTVRDKELFVWGHELAHCIYGTYHEKGMR